MIRTFRTTFCRPGRRLVLVMVAAMVMVLSSVAPASGQDVTAEQVDAAIDRGVEYLLGRQRDNGQWSGHDYSKPLPDTVRYPGQDEVVAMAALAYAERSLKNPKVKAGFDALLQLPLEKTYTLGVRMIAVAEFYRHEKDERQRALMRVSLQRDAQKLLSIQLRHGAWFYNETKNQNVWCFSNTQIAILGLQQAVSCGVELPAEPIRRVQELYLAKQRDDGGWNYGRPGANWENKPSYGSMTAAGVASLLLTRDMLNPGAGCPCSGTSSRPSRDPRVDQAIQRGMEWLGNEFRASTNPGKGSSGHAGVPYWLYAAERVGIATGIKYFGEHDWYGEGAAQLLSKQRSDGSWGSMADTMFSMLFLVKGRGPILMNKLMYDGPWDQHPHDMANLCQYVGEAKEQQFNWQVIHLGLPVEEWHDAPVLFISTEQPIELSAEQKQKLRAYTDSGGTILVEASCSNRSAQLWWNELFKEVWPEFEMSRVGKDHPVWKADLQITGRTPVLMGMNDGLRTIIFYSPSDISCQLHLNQRTRNKPLFDLGNNLYAYTTDRGKLRTRLSGRNIEHGQQYADQFLERGWERQELKVVRLKHNGDWTLGRHYRQWQVLGERLKEKAQVQLTMADEAVAAGKDVAADVDVVYISGRRGFGLPRDGQKWLKEFTDNGGLIVADAVMGGEDFDTAFRAEIAKAGLVLRNLGADHALLSGEFGEGRGYKIGDVEFTYNLRRERIRNSQPVLVGIFSGDRMVGVYSPFDLMYAQTSAKAFDSRGYMPADAEAIAANIVIWASSQPRP